MKPSRSIAALSRRCLRTEEMGAHLLRGFRSQAPGDVCGPGKRCRAQWHWRIRHDRCIRTVPAIEDTRIDTSTCAPRSPINQRDGAADAAPSPVTRPPALQRHRRSRYRLLTGRPRCRSISRMSARITLAVSQHLPHDHRGGTASRPGRVRAAKSPLHRAQSKRRAKRTAGNRGGAAELSRAASSRAPRAPWSG